MGSESDLFNAPGNGALNRSDSDPIHLDHLVVAARTLEEGAAWVEERLGVATVAGGKHATMGTHNRLLSLGPGRYLEVIAIDPDAPSLRRPRWFGLDDATTIARLARGPALIHWVARTADIARTLTQFPELRPEVLSLERGDYRWKIGVPADGSLAGDGTVPTFIEWQGKHPSHSLTDGGCRLDRLVLRHRDAAHTLRMLHRAGLAEAEPIEAQQGEPGLEAHIRTPRGPVMLAE